LGKDSIVIIGDTHFPFTSRTNVERIINYVRMTKPAHIIQIGDLYDMYAFSKFPLKRNIYTPEAEMGLGREMAQEMWEALRKASGRSKRWQIKGNHDERPYKRVAEKSPEFNGLLADAIDPFFRFPSVETYDDPRDALFINGTVFMHGFRSKIGDHSRHNRLSTVCGHSHQGGVVFIRQGDDTIWELNAGYVGDEYSVPLQFGPAQQRQFSRWTQGFGCIDEHGPRFIVLPNTK